MWFFKNKNRLGPLTLIVIAEILWGFNVVASKIGIETIPIYMFAAVKLVIASLILLPLARRHWTPIKRTRDLVILIVSSWVGMGLSMVFLYRGLAESNALVASLILSISPIVVYFLSIKTLREKFEPKVLVGSVIALGGVVLIIFDPNGNGSQTVIGGVLLVLSVITSALGTITKKPLLDRYHVYQLAFMNLVASAIPLSIFGYFELATFQIEQVTVAGWLSVFYGAVGSLVVAFTIYYKGLQNLTMERASVFDYLLPIFGVIAAMIVLSEQPDQSFIIGSVIVIVGLTISQVRIPHLLYLHHRSHH